MTMVVSTKRASFAVLAAESLHGRPGGQPNYFRKVVSHPSLPLAFAVSGTMWIPVNGQGAPAVTQLERFAATITSLDELTVPQVADRVRRLVESGLEEMQNTTQVSIALVKNGIADVGVQQISAASIGAAPTRFFHSCQPIVPTSLSAFYSQPHRLEFLHDPDDVHPESVGQRARTVIQQCIDQERTMNPHARNEVIGGWVDVVLVTPEGSRLLL